METILSSANSPILKIGLIQEGWIISSLATEEDWVSDAQSDVNDILGTCVNETD